MSDTQPFDAQSMNRALNPLSWLAAATDRFFSRLYGGLQSRSADTDTSSNRENLENQKATLIAERAERLKSVLRQREVEIERLNGILATIEEGIIMQDLDGRIVLINRAAQDLLGSQKNFWESEVGMLFDSYRDVVRVETELAPLGEPTRLQVNNRILGAQLAAVADSQGERIGTMIVLRDVTRDAVADRLKDQFVTAISHELRTPMTVIKGASEVLSSLGDGQPVNRRLLETLTRNVDTLDRMVVELLDISEMGAGSFTVRHDRVDLEPLLWSIVNSLAADVKRSQLSVMVMLRDAPALTVVGDEQRLRWALGHLLQNSIRYTEPEGQIILAAGISVDHAGHIAIDVIDSGVGISEKDMPHIFERFYRGEPRTRTGRLLDPRGLGQGLFIARTVADAHGGYLTARSSPGDGSAFKLVLPLALDLPE